MTSPNDGPSTGSSTVLPNRGARLHELLADTPSPKVLEIGSRHVTRGWPRPDHWNTTGIDIHPGPGVDVVGDAHRLADLVGAECFDAAYSRATFEHLLMPWKVIDAIARVLRPGGVVWIETHESFPLHEVPWDFWRFGWWTWEELVAGSGLELIDRTGLIPVRVEPTGKGQSFDGFASCEVYLRKVGEPTPGRRWDVEVDEVLPPSHRYPVARSGWRPIANKARLVPKVATRPLTERRAAPPDPLGRDDGAAAWLVLAGPAARASDHDTNDVVHLPADAAGRLDARAMLRGLADGELRNLALVDVLQRDPEPWTLALEAARVLRPGGRLFVETTQVAPTEFGGWRISAEGLRSLFHPAAGFVDLDVASFEPARVISEHFVAGRARCWLVVRGLAVRGGEIDTDRLRW